MKGTIYTAGFDLDVEDLNNTEITKSDGINEAIEVLVKRYGIIDGLNIIQSVAGVPTLTITVGRAVDKNGVIIHLTNSNITIGITDIEKWLVVKYVEKTEREVAHPITGVSSATRKVESYILAELPERLYISADPLEASVVGLEIPLCKITGIAGGNVSWSEDLVTDRYQAQLRVGEQQLKNDQIASDAEIIESKVKFNDSLGHTHTGTLATGSIISYNDLQDKPTIIDPAVMMRVLFAAGLISLDPDLLKPYVSLGYNAVYFSPSVNNENFAYISGRKFIQLYSGGDPISLPGIYYNFAADAAAGYYIIYLDGISDGVLKVASVADWGGSINLALIYHLDHPDYLPLCAIELSSIGVVNETSLVDSRPFGVVGNRQLAYKHAVYA